MPYKSPADAKRRVDEVLAAVETVAAVTDAGHTAPAFRDGQPDVRDRVVVSGAGAASNARAALGPDRVLKFQRHPAF